MAVAKGEHLPPAVRIADGALTGFLTKGSFDGKALGHTDAAYQVQRPSGAVQRKKYLPGGGLHHHQRLFQQRYGQTAQPVRRFRQNRAEAHYPQLPFAKDKTRDRLRGQRHHVVPCGGLRGFRCRAGQADRLHGRFFYLRGQNFQTAVHRAGQGKREALLLKYGIVGQRTTETVYQRFAQKPIVAGWRGPVKLEHLGPAPQKRPRQHRLIVGIFPKGAKGV